MNPVKYRYIVVEGPIGVGKTSLARRIAAETGAQALLEQPQENPFLERFYQDAARYALPAHEPVEGHGAVRPVFSAGGI